MTAEAVGSAVDFVSHWEIIDFAGAQAGPPAVPRHRQIDAVGYFGGA
jgi:hypothetical protein